MGHDVATDIACLASVATAKDVKIIHDPDSRSFPERFYRLRRPEFPVADAEAEWFSHVEGDYQFKLQHWVDYHVFTGTVTVTNGQKTITGAQLDGQPMEQPDPGTLTSIDGLFASLQEAQLAGCRRVAATYDPTDGFPAWCAVEQRG